MVFSLSVGCRCFCAVPYKGRLYVFGGESEKLNKKMKMRGKRELNRNTMWSVVKFYSPCLVCCFVVFASTMNIIS